MTTVILVDDDELVRMTWAFAAKRSEISLSTFASAETVMDNLDTLDRQSPVYVDLDLGTSNGLVMAKRMYEEGFETIYLATGHDEARLNPPSWLAGVVGKTPPWTTSR